MNICRTEELINGTGSCPYDCKMKSSSGYCMMTACMNPKYNGSGTWYAKTCHRCLYTWYSRIKEATPCPQCGRKTEA